MDIYIIKEHEDDYLKLVRDGQLIYFNTASDPNTINWNYPAYEFSSVPRALAIFNRFVLVARTISERNDLEPGSLSELFFINLFEKTIRKEEAIIYETNN